MSCFTAHCINNGNREVKQRGTIKFTMWAVTIIERRITGVIQGESVSIENQKLLLELSKFVMLNAWIEKKVYADDGYGSGNFQRPAYLNSEGKSPFAYCYSLYGKKTEDINFETD